MLRSGVSAEAEKENKVLLHLFPSDPIPGSGLCTVSQGGRIQRAEGGTAGLGAFSWIFPQSSCDNLIVHSNSLNSHVKHQPLKIYPVFVAARLCSSYCFWLYYLLGFLWGNF